VEIWDLYMRMLLCPCLEGCCLPLVVAYVSTRRRPHVVSLKHTILNVCLWIAATAHIVVLKEMMTFLAPSGSWILPGVITQPAPKWELMRRSRVHDPYGYENHSFVTPSAYSIFSSSFRGSLLCCSPAFSKIVTPSARSSSGGSGVFLVSTTGFRQRSSTAYLMKSGLSSGRSSKLRLRPAGLCSYKSSAWSELFSLVVEEGEL